MLEGRLQTEAKENIWRVVVATTKILEGPQQVNVGGVLGAKKRYHATTP